MEKQGKKRSIIQGTSRHRRTEHDYMSVLLDVVTLDDWREVVAGALQAAKEGNQQARVWLAQYLVGKSEARAPTPIHVISEELSGNEPLVEILAKPVIDQALFPAFYENNSLEDDIKAQIAEELDEKVSPEKNDTTQMEKQGCGKKEILE